MQQILIISPDPESRKTFELALELAGFSVVTALDFGDLPAGSYETILFEMVEDSAEQWQAAAKVISMKRLAKAFAVILPHGIGDREALKELRKTSLLIKRPFELMNAVERIREISRAAKKPPAKSKKPAAKVKKPEAARGRKR